MPNYRIEQINELLRHELGELFVRELTFPKDCLVTITKVDTSRDLSQSKIFISVLPTNLIPAVQKKMTGAASAIRRLLGKKIILRKIPNLLFFTDLSGEKVSRIDELIDKIHQEE